MTTTFGIAEKLHSGQSVTIQTLGDSTVFGSFDTAMSGWAGRLGVNFGKAFNTTVQCAQYSTSGSYNPAVTLNTGSGVNQILVRDAGEPGWKTADVAFALNTMLNVANPDLIIHGTGFNDINAGLSATQYVAYIHQLITGIKAKCPGVPIIITTENVANSSSYDAAFNALANDLVGSSLPISPALQASTTLSGVWLMDTRQAFNNTWQSGLMTDTLHPNSAGYQAQADWMYNLLVAGYGAPVGVAPSISTTSLSDMTVDTAFTQTIAATGTDPITWSVATGIIPDGLALGEDGVLSGTPSTPGSYDFTVRATNSYGHDDHRFAGTIIAEVVNGFVPDSVMKPKVRLDGLWYPVTMKVRQSGSFIGFVPRA